MADRRYEWATFLSDYGVDDVFVGVCKGVLAQRCPQLRIIDVCHLVDPQDVRQGATVFASAMPYLPVAIHLAVVDPVQPDPVRGVLLETADGSSFVGPDNGILSQAADAVGGVTAAYEITNEHLWLSRQSRMFRGRDIFAPVAAYVATGGAPDHVGPPIDPSGLHRIARRAPSIDDDHVHAEVINVDHFGNLTLNVSRADLESAGMSLGDRVELRCGGRAMRVPFAVTYGEVPRGRLAICEDSFRAVMIAANLGHAARLLGIRRGDPAVIARLPQEVGRPPGPPGAGRATSGQ